jgi:ParB family transcriptional regulator, chromosome partitioning protein
MNLSELEIDLAANKIKANPASKPPLKTFLDHIPCFDFDISALIKQAADMAKSPLGRGLSALLSGNTPTAPEVPAPSKVTPKPTPTEGTEEVSLGNGTRELGMDQVRPCSFQPRKDFDDESLKDLAASIKEQGIIQPLVVRPRDGVFELIAGERRWRAAQMAGLKKVPAVIREADDREVVEMALVENLQRENLNPIEEAIGYQQLIGQFELRQEEAAQKVGKSRASVANALRLLKLPETVQSFLKEGQISVGHAKVILGLSDDSQRLNIAKRVSKDRLSVRETEAIVNQTLTESKPPSAAKLTPPKAAPRDANLVRIEEKICQRFKTRVALKYNEGKGSVELKFFTDEDLERIIQMLGIEPD